MRRRVFDDSELAKREAPRPEPTRVKIQTKTEVVVPHDPVNEAVVLAAAAVSPVQRKVLVRRVPADCFQVREHAEAWAALCELERRHLEYSEETVEAFASSNAARTIQSFVEARPEVPANIDFHVAQLFWDRARANAARGPLTAVIEAIRDPKSDPARVRGLAKSLAQSVEGFEERGHLHEPGELVRAQMVEIEKRIAGYAHYPYGVDGLDFFEPEVKTKRRMLPGAAPGQVTVVTATTGGGKSTFTANMVLGMAFPEGVDRTDVAGRRILYGAWEMNGGMTLELLACISLGWSRSALTDPQGAPNAPINTHEGRVRLEERMNVIAKRVRFLANPFRRRAGEKTSNDRNLDLVQGYIADSGCDVFVADLWKRCLRVDDPSEEEAALYRQQAMAEETRCHCVLLQQQRLKDVETRPDKRPTREGIKGSGAWSEIADTVIGVHRPALFKSVDDDKMEVFVLKQRHGKWPLGIEFDWDADRGMVWGGREIDYDRPGQVSEGGDPFTEGDTHAQRRQREGKYKRTRKT